MHDAKYYESLFKEPVFSYPFNAALPVESYKDNEFDQHQHRRGELGEIEHEWEKDIKDFDEDDKSQVQTFNIGDIEAALNGVVEEPKLGEIKKRLREKKR